MKPALVTSLFALAVAYQLGVPASVVADRERVLRHGEALKIRTAPVDPYDAFRGRFVALGFENRSLPLAGTNDVRHGAWMYVQFTNDAAGFASPAAVAVEQPEAGPYLRLRAPPHHGGTVSVRLPFDRYYLDEERAPKAESAFRAASSRTNRDAYVVLRVLGGRGVLEDLVVAGRSARELGP